MWRGDYDRINLPIFQDIFERWIELNAQLGSLSTAWFLPPRKDSD